MRRAIIRTVMFLGVDGRMVGMVALADTLKPIAREVGITRVLAEILPERKVQEVEKLQNEGKVAAMINTELAKAGISQAEVGEISKQIAAAGSLVILIKQLEQMRDELQPQACLNVSSVYLLYSPSSRRMF